MTRRRRQRPQHQVANSSSSNQAAAVILTTAAAAPSAVSLPVVLHRVRACPTAAAASLRTTSSSITTTTHSSSSRVFSSPSYSRAEAASWGRCSPLVDSSSTNSLVSGTTSRAAAEEVEDRPLQRHGVQLLQRAVVDRRVVERRPSTRVLSFNTSSPPWMALFRLAASRVSSSSILR